MKQLILVLSICFFGLTSCNKKDSIIVMSYNVENLFDTINDPLIDDEEFTPESKKEWTTERYNKKLTDIARVIANIDSTKLPAIVALQEIENRTVLEDLVKQKSLESSNYQIVHVDSPDKRGIDVALLYNPSIFKFKNFETLAVEIEFNTRDILHVTGNLSGNSFHFFVNHWPSRIGGLQESEGYRATAAKVLKNSINRILDNDPKANIVVLGDMNDEPSNKSLYNVLNAKEVTSGAELVNLMLAKHKAKQGTYKYRDTWNMLDNIVVSQSLLDTKGLNVVDSTGYIFHKPFMEYTNDSNEKIPNRTYGGPNYYGGVSDHFPIYMILK
ncbi:MAG: endonuclease/exonuclease/phosphatase family protein [Mangrovibacterium sp.]